MENESSNPGSYVVVKGGDYQQHRRREYQNSTNHYKAETNLKRHGAMLPSNNGLAVFKRIPLTAQ
jgi:hypothetical protein